MSRTGIVRRKAALSGRIVVAAALLALAAWQPAVAYGQAISLPEDEQPRNAIGLSGGVFAPYEGDAGFAVGGHYLRSVTERIRVGGELEFRSYSSEILGIDDVDVQVVALRGLFHYVIAQEPVRPYVGVGLGFNIDIIDEPRIDSDVGTGVGIIGIGGLEIPLADTVAIFAEGRVGADVQLTDNNGDIDAENLGGVTGLGGVRFSF